MGGFFFVTWQLWEEMTFVLACSIVVVFIVALFKLWRTNRQLRRHEQLDEEKKARLAEMRRVGLSPSKKRTDNIPFGVRAIQSGVEVEGIWISQPTTPSHSSSRLKPGPPAPAVEATAERVAANSKSPIANQKHSPTTETVRGRPYSIPILAGGRPIPQRPAAWPLGGDRLSSRAKGAAGPSNAYDSHSNTSTPLPQISEDDILPDRDMNAGRGAGALNDNALRSLEGSRSSGSPRPQQLTTYMPSSRIATTPDPSRQHGRHQYDRHQSQTTTSHNHDAIDGQYRGMRRHIPRSSVDSASISGVCSNRSSTHSICSVRSVRSNNSVSTSSRPQAGSYGEAFVGLATSRVAKESCSYAQLGLLSSPVRLPTPYGNTSSVLHPARDVTMTPPLGTFGPADAFANRANRRINPGFEVLPAGTFVGLPGHLPHDSNSSIAADGEVDDPRVIYRGLPTAQCARKKLRKSGTA